ncbi:hypothetical protein SH139x_002769 [Planctomycetaceae bacterium SH139]
MSASVFFDDFFGAPSSGSGLTAEEAAQLAAAAALADRLPEVRTAKLDLDLAHAGVAALYQANLSGLVTSDLLPANFSLLQIDLSGQVTIAGDTSLSAAAVWDYFVAASGDAAVNRIGTAVGLPGEASFQLSFTVHDQDNQPVRFVRLSLAGSAVARTTNQFGEAILHAEPGDYQLLVEPPFGFAPVPPQAITVAVSDQTIALTVPRELPALTVAPESCAVTLQVIDQAGLPLADLSITHRVSAGYAVLDDQWMVNTIAPAITNSSGIAQLVAARGQVYDFTVQVSSSNQVTIRRLIPDAESATLSMMVEA